MQRTLLLTGFGLMAGLVAGVPLASPYLNYMAGLGLNGGEPFSFVTGFPGITAAGSGPWVVAIRIVGGAAVVFGVLAFLLSLRQELTEYGQARFQRRAELKKAGLLRPIGEGLVFAKLGRPKSRKPYISAAYDKFPHCLVVAPTRAGKGVGYVIPNTLHPLKVGASCKSGAVVHSGSRSCRSYLRTMAHPAHQDSESEAVQGSPRRLPAKHPVRDQCHRRNRHTGDEAQPRIRLAKRDVDLLA